MKLTIKHFEIPSTHEFDTLVERSLLSVEPQLRIEDATVSLGFFRERSPAYVARINIVTPGPDVSVEGADHTLKAAFQQAMNNLERRLNERNRSRARRRRGNRHQSVQKPRKAPARVT